MSLRAKAKNSDKTPRERFKGARYISDCNIRDFKQNITLIITQSTRWTFQIYSPFFGCYRNFQESSADVKFRK